MAGGVSTTILLADIPSFVNCNIMSVMFVIYCSTVRPRWSKSATTESLEPSNKTTAPTLPLGLWSHWRILERISLLKAEVYPLNPRLRTSHFLVGKIFSSSVRKKNLLSNTVMCIIALTEWESRTEKYLAWGQDVRTERSEVHVSWLRAKYFHVQPDLTQSISILSYDHLLLNFFDGANLHRSVHISSRTISIFSSPTTWHVWPSYRTFNYRGFQNRAWAIWIIW